jgi:hypothetical protein
MFKVHGTVDLHCVQGNNCGVIYNSRFEPAVNEQGRIANNAFENRICTVTDCIDIRKN